MTHRDLFLPCLAKLVHSLFDRYELLKEEAILAWYEQLDGEAAKVIRPKLTQLVEWLKDDDDDDEE